LEPNSSNELAKYEVKYELVPVNETPKNEKKKNITVTAQAAVTAIDAILLILAPPTAVAAGLFAAVPLFTAAACFTGVPHEAQNFSPAFTGFPHFEQLAIISLLAWDMYRQLLAEDTCPACLLVKTANANDVGKIGIAKQVGGALFSHENIDIA
jgi:hypothetical protein